MSVYEELANKARGTMGPVCKACSVCDGRVCASKLPGPGDKGMGKSAYKNFAAWQALELCMDTLYEAASPTCQTTLFGRTASAPIMVGPIGDVGRHYGNTYTTSSYNKVILDAAQEFQTYAFTGDGLIAAEMPSNCQMIEDHEGWGIATIKPWSMKTVFEKLDIAKAHHPQALAMDIDAAGLPFLKGQEPPAGPKSVDELAQIIEYAGVPFIVKGVMSVAAAQKAVAAGASAIIVSNHGGRVLDGTPATAHVLPAIVEAVGSRVEVYVDGGIRSGVDVFRALALGARGVLVCRPVVVCAFGGGSKGVYDYLEQLKGELLDTMLMCGATSLDQIDRSMFAL